MPVCRNLGSIGAADTHNEGSSLGVGITRHGPEVAPFDDRRPFQIAEMHDLVRVRGFFFLLAVHARTKHQSCCGECENVNHAISFHEFSSVGNTECAEDTAPSSIGQARKQLVSYCE